MIWHERPLCQSLAQRREAIHEDTPADQGNMDMQSQPIHALYERPYRASQDEANQPIFLE
ncbi:MAG: hypothetical protein JO031_09475 [Ktedonobacteraceae bacterium]|nr:hypothetical protein [Ktedonobacteraceae bacterium]